MALYRRGRVWWIKLRLNDGQTLRKSSGTTDKKCAKELHDKLSAERWRTDKLGERPGRTWDDAAEQWLVETRHKIDHRHDAAKIEWLRPYLGGLRLREVDRETVRAIGERKARATSPSTANRYLALIRAILRKAAYEWEWIDSPPKVRLFKEPTRRIRWLTREEAERLLKELPAHQAYAARFALATGLRQRNVLDLRWEDIDTARRTAWVHPDQAKAKRAICVPLNADAMRVLEALAGGHPTHVFSYKGKPIKNINTKAWKAALKRAGIKDFRWHDLRHTWASWHAQAGTPQHVLQELGAWESPSMVRRYAHFGPGHLAAYAEIIVRSPDASGPDPEPQEAVMVASGKSVAVGD
jgi:integrase